MWKLKMALGENVVLENKKYYIDVSEDKNMWFYIIRIAFVSDILTYSQFYFETLSSILISLSAFVIHLSQTVLGQDFILSAILYPAVVIPSVRVRT